MTERDVENQEDIALARVLRLRRTLAVAQAKANEIAGELECVAKQLRTEIYQISPDSYAWLVPDSLGAVIADVTKAKAELSDAEIDASRLGVVVPPPPDEVKPKNGRKADA